MKKISILKILGRKGLAPGLLLLASVWFACTTGKIRTNAVPDVPAVEPLLSLIDIDYLLGRSRYHLILEAKKGAASGKNYLEQTLIASGAFTRAQYRDFLSRVRQFMQTHSQSNGELASATRCQGPFTIRVQDSGTTEVLKGCRSSDDGTFSRLVRDGEFFLYSKD